MTPERLDHMTVQYVWGLESDQVFMVRAKHEVDRGHFAQFRRLVGSYIMPIRKMLDEDKAHALSGAEWSFLYLEMWKRLGGSCSPYGFSTENNYAEFDYQLDRLTSAGFCLTTRGVERRQDNQNPCAEIVLGEPQPCTLQEPQQENTMSQIIKIETITFLNGTPIDKIGDDELIAHIKQGEEDIAELKKVKAKSEKIKAKIAELEANIGKLVEILDARA